MASNNNENKPLNRAPSFTEANSYKKQVDPFTRALILESIKNKILELTRSQHTPSEIDFDHQKDPVFKQIFPFITGDLLNLYNLSSDTNNLNYRTITWPNLKITRVHSLSGLQSHHDPVINTAFVYFLQDIHNIYQLFNYQVLHHEVHHAVSNTSLVIKGYKFGLPELRLKHYGFYNEGAEKNTGLMLNEALLEYYANKFVLYNDSIRITEMRVSFGSEIKWALEKSGRKDLRDLVYQMQALNDLEYHCQLCKIGLNLLGSPKYAIAAEFYSRLIAEGGQNLENLLLQSRLDHEKIGELESEFSKLFGKGSLRKVLATPFDVVSIEKLMLELF